MADSKTTIVKTIAGGEVTTTPIARTTYHNSSRTNSEVVNNYGFAAIKSDGSVVAWGQNATVPTSLNGTIDAKQIYSNYDFFVALRTDGSVIPLGYQNINADTLKKLDGTVKVTSVSSTYYSFAAIREDGSVVTWGDKYSDSSSVAKQLDGTIDVTSISSAYYSFAAIRADGSVVTWGASNSGGNSSPVAKQLDGTIDVTSVVSNEAAFAAIRADGSVVTWGSSTYGGDSSSVASQLDGSIDVKQITSIANCYGYYGFAALRVDGSVVNWGNVGTVPKDQLDGTVDVVELHTNGNAFSALRADGSVITWGVSNQGGDSSAVKSSLISGVEVFANVATNEFYTAKDKVIPPEPPKPNVSGTLTIDGTVKENETLTVVNQITDVDGLGKMNYQWLVEGVGITGAIQTSYVLSQMDVSKKISVAAYYTDEKGTRENVISAATQAIANVNDLPKGSVSISGTTAKGQVLTATNTLSDVDGLGAAITYQWLRGGVAIIGATASTYKLADADMFKKISVTANYTDLQNSKESVASNETTIVTEAINHAPTGTVLISGELKQNKTVSVSNNLADVDGLGAISYQWLGNGAAIKDAIKPPTN